MAQEDGEEELLDKLILILEFCILALKLNLFVKLIHFIVKLISDDFVGFVLKWGYLKNILLEFIDNLGGSHDCTIPNSKLIVQ